MRLADAFEIVLDLVRQGVLEFPIDDEVQEAQQLKQEAAIVEIEEFVRTYDFDDEPNEYSTEDVPTDSFDGYGYGD